MNNVAARVRRERAEQDIFRCFVRYAKKYCPDLYWDFIRMEAEKNQESCEQVQSKLEENLNG